MPWHNRIVWSSSAAAPPGLPLATRQLGDTLGRRGQATITLVDHNASHLWKPLLHEVAAGRRGRGRARRRLLADGVLASLPLPPGRGHGTRPRAPRVEARRRARRRRRGNAAASATVPYDTLVFCVGSVSNDFGIPGVAERAISLDDAGRCRTVPSPAARGVRARRRARGARRIGDGRDRDHRRGRDRRRARRRNPPLHAARMRATASNTCDPERDIRLTLHRSRTAHPAAAVRDDRRRRDRASGEARRRRCAPASASPRSTPTACIRRAAPCCTPISSSGRRASRRRPGSRELDGLEVNRAHQLVVATTLVDHARSRTSSRWATAPRARGRRAGGGRDPAAARAGRAAAGVAAREEHQARLAGKPLPTLPLHAISDRSSRWASCPRWATLMGRLHRRQPAGAGPDRALDVRVALQAAPGRDPRATCVSRSTRFRGSSGIGSEPRVKLPLSMRGGALAGERATRASPTAA